MKTHKVNCFSLQDTVRFFVMILIAINVLALAAEGARSNRDYRIVSKYPRSFTPRTISTARGFGKRNDNTLEPSRLNHQDTMILSLLKNVPRRFPTEVFVQFLKMNPTIARRVEKSLFSNEKNTRSSDAQVYKNNKSDVSYYFDEFD